MEGITTTEDETEDEPTRVVLVGCGSAKHEGKLPAGAKYSSNYFGLKRDYAQVIGDYWAITSAKYGLVEPHEWVDDYDESVRDKSASEQAAWGRAVGTSIVSLLTKIEKMDERPDELHLLLGKAYLDPLEEDLAWIRERTDIDVVEPFEDTSGIGEQMSELKDAVAEYEDN